MYRRRRSIVVAEGGNREVGGNGSGIGGEEERGVVKLFCSAPPIDMLSEHFARFEAPGGLGRSVCDDKVVKMLIGVLRRG